MTIDVNDQQTCGGCLQLLRIDAFARISASNPMLRSLCRACDLARGQVRRHGLTAEQKAALATIQDGCALCGRMEPGRKGWVIDHDRSCCPGDVSCWWCRRAVLCQWCNNALGYALDNPAVLRRMADYLELGTRLAMPEVVT